MKKNNNHELIRKHLDANKRQHYYNMQLNNNKKAKGKTESIINTISRIIYHKPYYNNDTYTKKITRL